MTESITVTSDHEVTMTIQAEPGVVAELHTFFSFFVPGYKFVPSFKNKLWDGKIYLFNRRTHRLYRGLLSHLQTFCQERGYELNLDPILLLTQEFSLQEAEDFIQSLKLPLVPREYQVKAFVHAVRFKRSLIVSPTGSGKSLILYLLVRWAHRQGLGPGLLITPLTSLVEQLYSDFQSYGWDVEKYVSRQYGDQKASDSTMLTISTWQSLYTKPAASFAPFRYVLGDEAHLYQAKSLQHIMTSLTNASLRVGCTGTLDGTKCNRLVLEGVFGSVHHTTTTQQLIVQKQLAPFRIKCLVLTYPKATCQMTKTLDYQGELDFIVSNQARRVFVKNLVLSLTQNTLVLFNYVEKHGKPLFEMIQAAAGTRPVHFVFGGVPAKDREVIRLLTEQEQGSIIIASSAVFSTGMNCHNLHNLVFASPSKSRIRNLQSIGRVLRTHDSKEEAVLFDIVDDLRIGKHQNFALKHFIERMGVYDSEQFPTKQYPIDLANG